MKFRMQIIGVAPVADLFAVTLEGKGKLFAGGQEQEISGRVVVTTSRAALNDMDLGSFYTVDINPEVKPA